MKTPRRSGKKDKVGQKPGLSADEIIALEHFCADVRHDGASFETWQETHESLDITVPLFISAVEAQLGLSREITYVRQISSEVTGRRHTVKEKASVVVQIPAAATEGCTISVSNQGDCHQGRTGDVRVIIRFKA